MDNDKINTITYFYSSSKQLITLNSELRKIFEMKFVLKGNLKKKNQNYNGPRWRFRQPSSWGCFRMLQSSGVLPSKGKGWGISEPSASGTLSTEILEKLGYSGLRIKCRKSRLL